MEIDHYKKIGKNKYKIILTNNMELTLYEDVILKYELLLTKEIKEKDLSKIKKDNSYYEAYYTAVKSLTAKFKSIHDTRVFLKNKEYDEDTVNKVISKLLEQGYLNDESFAKSFINTKIITTNNGPYKVYNELSKHNIATDILDKEIKAYDEELQISRIDKIINKLIRSNNSRGGAVLRNKIINDLINLGYSKEMIDKVINNYSFSNDKELAEREYNKLYARLSRKYSGEELKYKIKEKMYQKGLYYDE